MKTTTQTTIDRGIDVHGYVYTADIDEFIHLIVVPPKLFLLEDMSVSLMQRSGGKSIRIFADCRLPGVVADALTDDAGIGHGKVSGTAESEGVPEFRHVPISAKYGIFGRNSEFHKIKVNYAEIVLMTNYFMCDFPCGTPYTAIIFSHPLIFGHCISNNKLSVQEKRLMNKGVFKHKAVIRQFQDNLKAEKKAQNTVLSYIDDLNAMESLFRDKTMAEIESLTKESILDAVRARSDATTCRRLSSLRKFFSFLVVSGHLSANPCGDIRIHKKKANPVQRSIPYDDIRRLIESMPIRDRAIFSLAYDSGGRIGEVLQIEYQNLIPSIERGFFLVRRKGQNTTNGRLYFTTATADLIMSYCENGRQHDLQTPEALFTSNQNTRLTYQAVQKIFKHYASKCGMGGIRIHDLRHSSATHLIESGMNIRIVQEILGHKNISTTMLYTVPSTEAVRKEFQKFRTVKESTDES